MLTAGEWVQDYKANPLQLFFGYKIAFKSLPKTNVEEN